MMGGRGGFIKEGGFNKYRYEIVDFVDGVKVLEPKDKSETHSLPERSNSPCTSYMCYYKKKHKDDEDVFKGYIIFDKNRMPIYRIDYGVHQGPKFLHVHYFENGELVGKPKKLHPGDELYEKHKRLFKGVEL